MCRKVHIPGFNVARGSPAVIGALSHMAGCECCSASRAVAMEKAQWEKPVDGGAISERGRLEAAKNQVVVLRELMRVRGCKEEFVPNQALLEQGQVSSMRELLTSTSVYAVRQM